MQKHCNPALYILYVYNVQIFTFQIHAVLLNFEKPEKKLHTAVFNIIMIIIIIINVFFEQQIRILEYFLEDRVTGVMMQKNLL